MSRRSHAFRFRCGDWWSYSFDSFNLVARSNCFKTPEHNVVRFVVHPEVKARAPEAVAWVKEFLARFDTSLLGWLRIDFGREHQDRQGRIYHQFHGVYGRCWYPTEKQPSIHRFHARSSPGRDRSIATRMEHGRLKPNRIEARFTVMLRASDNGNGFTPEPR